MFKFRALRSEDFPQMLEWLAKPHVKKWWNDGDDTLEKVRLHYGEKSDEVARFILIETSGGVEKLIGYFQYYFAETDSIGIDQFIGEEKYINKGVGEKTIKMFVRLIAARHQPKNIVLDPSPDNKRAIRCYEKVGFRHYETKTIDDGQTAYLMRFENF